jgi:hypothetical protein
MDATFYADCEIIIKCFEKSAAFSSDPRSVYALSTTLISKGAANAKAVDKQVTYQMEHSESKKSSGAGSNEPTDTESNASDREEDEYNSPSEREGTQKTKSTTPATEWWNNIGVEGEDGWKLENCIPCGARINGAELAIQGIGGELQQWSEIIEENLKGIVNQMLGLLDMFKDQGRSALRGLCDFWNTLKLIKCPSDIMRIIAALTAALTKLSVDILGELGMMLNLAKAILTPILSSLVQLIKNFLQMIIAPIHCIIDALQKQLLEPVADVLTAASNSGAGFEFDFGSGSSTFADQDWSFSRKEPPKAPSSSVAGSLAGRIVTLNAVDAPEALADFHPPEVSSKEVWDATYKNEGNWQTYDQFTNLGADLESLAAAGKQDTEAYKGKKKAYDEAGLNQAIKSIREFNDSVNRTQQQFETIFEATLFHLQSIARYIEDLVEAWIGELAKLVGGALTVEFGFGQKGVQKLGLLTLIATCMSLLKFAKAGTEKCSNDEIESAIQDAFSGAPMGWILKKEEDGSLSILGMETTSSQFNLTKSGEASMDSYIDKATQALTAPSATVSFSCTNVIPQDADANQINEWINQLDEAGL